MNLVSRLYKAIVWMSNKDALGIRVEVMASSLENAEQQLKVKYGQDIIFTLYNEEDANSPR